LGGAGEGVLVQDFFGERTDQGFPAELAVVVILGALDDVVDMEGVLAARSMSYTISILDLRSIPGWGGGRCSARRRARRALSWESVAFSSTSSRSFLVRGFIDCEKRIGIEQRVA